jgi:hypothetical protein
MKHTRHPWRFALDEHRQQDDQSLTSSINTTLQEQPQAIMHHRLEREKLKWLKPWNSLQS